MVQKADNTTFSPDVPIFSRNFKGLPENRKWRKFCIQYINKNAKYFYTVDSENVIPTIRKRFDDDTAKILIISRILSLIYGDPRHGNPKNPLDNLEETTKDGVIVRHCDDGIAIAFVEMEEF